MEIGDADRGWIRSEKKRKTTRLLWEDGDGQMDDGGAASFLTSEVIGSRDSP